MERFRLHKPEPAAATAASRTAQAAAVSKTPRWVYVVVIGFSVSVLMGLAGLAAWLAAHAQAPAPAPQAAAAADASSAAASSAGGQPAASGAARAPAAAGVAISSDPQDYASHKDAAEEQLKAALPESNGLQFRNVRTINSPEQSEKVDFCGEVNSVNPEGAYVGYQRFISSHIDAKVEQAMSPGEFAQAWQARCTGAEGPQVWN